MTYDLGRITDLREISDHLEELADREADEDDTLDAEEAEEMAELRAFAESFRSGTGSDLADYARNEPNVVAEHDFEDYAEELAYDLGYVERDSQMSYYIDWAKWADATRVDYTSFDWDGTTYLVRSY